jgi:hypothetical protein
MPTYTIRRPTAMGDLWAFAQNQAGGGSPPPNTDVDYIVFAEDPWYGPPNGAGPYNGWGQYGTNTGDNVIYGLSVKSSGFNLGEYNNLQYFYDNNSGGGFLGTVKITNNLGNAMPPFFYNNNINVATQVWDSTYTYNYGNNSTNVSPMTTVGPANVTDPNSPILNTLYWRVILANGNTDTNALVDITINGASYVSGYPLPQYNSNLVLDWTTYGTATVANTGSGYYGFIVEVFFN